MSVKVRVSDKLFNQIVLVLLSVALFGISTSISADWNAPCENRNSTCTVNVNGVSPEGLDFDRNKNICGGPGTLCVGGDGNYAARSGCGCCSTGGHYDTHKHGLIEHRCR